MRYDVIDWMSNSWLFGGSSRHFGPRTVDTEESTTFRNVGISTCSEAAYLRRKNSSSTPLEKSQILEKSLTYWSQSALSFAACTNTTQY